MYAMRGVISLRRDVADQEPSGDEVPADFEPSPGASVARGPVTCKARLSANSHVCSHPDYYTSLKVATHALRGRAAMIMDTMSLSELARTLIMRLNGHDNPAQGLVLLHKGRYSDGAAERLLDVRIIRSNRQMATKSDRADPILRVLEHLPYDWEGKVQVGVKYVLYLANIVRILRSVPAKHESCLRVARLVGRRYDINKRHTGARPRCLPWIP